MLLHSYLCVCALLCQKNCYVHLGILKAHRFSKVCLSLAAFPDCTQPTSSAEGAPNHAPITPALPAWWAFAHLLTNCELLEVKGSHCLPVPHLQTALKARAPSPSGPLTFPVAALDAPISVTLLWTARNCVPLPPPPGAI